MSKIIHMDNTLLDLLALTQSNYEGKTTIEMLIFSDCDFQISQYHTINNPDEFGNRNRMIRTTPDCYNYWDLDKCIKTLKKTKWRKVWYQTQTDAIQEKLYYTNKIKELENEIEKLREKIK